MKDQPYAQPAFSAACEAIKLRVGAPLPFVNDRPGEEHHQLHFTPDFCHVHCFVAPVPEMVAEVVREFREVDLYYGFSEPVLGVAYLLLTFDAQQEYTLGVEFHQGRLSTNRRQFWQQQRPRLEQLLAAGGTVPLVLTLTCSDTHLILAVRIVAVPVEMALKARVIVQKVHDTTPDSFLNMMHAAIAEDLSATDLWEASEGGRRASGKGGRCASGSELQVSG